MREAGLVAEGGGRAESFAECGEEGDAVLRRAVERPATELLPRVVGEGADQRDRAGPGPARQGGPERQDGRVVLEQDHAPARGAAGELPVLRRERHARRGRLDVRALEEAEAVLQLEDAAHGLVEERHRHHAGGHQLREVVLIRQGGHLEIHARLERDARDRALVRADAVGNELGHRGPVAHHQSREAPLVLEQAADEPGVGRHGHAVQIVEGRHHRHHAGRDAGVEGRQVHLAELRLGDVGGVVVLARLGRSIADEVLGAGRDAIGRGRIRPLEAAHHGRPQHGDVVRSLAGALGDPTPARIARDVDHRREGPVDAVLGGLGGGRRRRRLDQLGVEGGAEPERDGEDGPVPVDDVAAEDEWDPEPGLLDREALEVVPQLAAGGVEEGADRARADGVERGLVGVLVVGALGELADLLLERHPGEEGLDGGEPRSRLDRSVGSRVGHRRRDSGEK